MINRIKNFAIFRAKPSENEKLPSHALSAKIGDEYVTIGGSWTKDSTNGKFLSSKLSDAWVDAKDNTKTRTGFSIVKDNELDELEKLAYGKEKIIDPSDGRDLSDAPF